MGSFAQKMWSEAKPMLTTHSVRKSSIYTQVRNKILCNEEILIYFHPLSYKKEDVNCKIIFFR